MTNSDDPQFTDAPHEARDSFDPQTAPLQGDIHVSHQEPLQQPHDYEAATQPAQDAPFATQPDAVDTKKPKSKMPVILAATLGAIGGALIVVIIASVVFAGYLFKTNSSQTIKADAANIAESKESTSTDLSVSVAEKVLPSVVSITVKGITQTDSMTGQTYATEGSGSGVLIKNNGYILTNNHVINGGTNIEVLVGAKTYKAKIIGIDSTTDLAVLKIDGNNFNPINIGTSSDLKVGQYVMALGSPFGLDNSVSTGIISGLGRSNMVQDNAQISTYVNLIQTDAAVNPGNSGGALVNEAGQLIGINTLISSTSGSSAGVGFAIPVDTAVDIANQLINTGKASHPFMGVSTQSINEQVAQAYSLPVDEGAYVVYVAANSPASKAGLTRGDIITEINGEDVETQEDVYTQVRTHKVGDEITVTYYRGNKKMTAKLRLVADTSVQTSQSSSSSPTQQDSYNTQQEMPGFGLAQ